MLYDGDKAVDKNMNNTSCVLEVIYTMQLVMLHEILSLIKNAHALNRI